MGDGEDTAADTQEWMQVLHVLDPPLKSEDEGEEGATAQSNHSSIPVGPEHAELGERAKAGASLPQGGSGLGWGYTKCLGGRCGPSKPGRHSLSGNDHTENCLISLCSLQARTSSEQNASEVSPASSSPTSLCTSRPSRLL